VSSAVINSDGDVRQLDTRAGEPIVITSEDVKDDEKLARLLQDALRELAALRRRFAPRMIEFEDQAVTAGQALRVTHNFGGRVRYWPVDWRPTTPGDAPLFDKSTSTDEDTLVLTVGNAGTVTILVREAG
jgi:hypothetical protein